MSLRLRRIGARAYTVPTEEPESDGTLEWDSTTLVVVECEAGAERGIGYAYSDRTAAQLVEVQFAPLLAGHEPMSIGKAWLTLHRAVRNMGSRGIAASAISAVDGALWDLKARLLGVSLADLLGPVRAEVPVYGSGGFTSYDLGRLQEQLARWAGAGFGAVKMKVGRDPEADPRRVAAARQAIGEDVDLYVDANGAYDRKQALAMAERFAEQAVVWFEEPVSSDDLEGLRLLRDRSPAGMEVTAGEYGFGVDHLRRLLETEAVDVLQADATRCGGITGFRSADELCWAHHRPLSSHTAPMLHLAPAAASRAFRNLEWFYDHVRIERMLFDGFVEPEAGMLAPDRARPGLGLELKRADAERYEV